MSVFTPNDHEITTPNLFVYVTMAKRVKMSIAIQIAHLLAEFGNHFFNKFVTISSDNESVIVSNVMMNL